MAGVVIRAVAEDETDLRLDRWFRRHYPSVPHGQLERLLRTGQVRVDGKRAKGNTRLVAGARIRIPPPVAPHAAGGSPGPTVPSPRDADWLRSLVLHEDEAVVVVDKPSGLAVQGGSGTHRHLDGLLDALRGPGGERPRLVHRLDKDTSGVLVLGRSAAAAAALTRSFRDHAARKTYWALVEGLPDPAAGTIDAALAKGRRGDRELMQASPEGRGAATRYRVVASADERSWLELVPLTGRTHQLRVHCALIGTPIVGDGKYGRPATARERGDGERLHLHARRIVLPHPQGGTLDVTAPLPPHMAASWRRLGFDADRAGA